jgi:hypothetical protein
MCKRCHDALSDDEVGQQLIEEINHPNFERWNETSMNHLTITMSGANGPQNAKLAFQLYDQYNSWKRNKTIFFIIKLIIAFIVGALITKYLFYYK